MLFRYVLFAIFTITIVSCNIIQNETYTNKELSNNNDYKIYKNNIPNTNNNILLFGIIFLYI